MALIMPWFCAYEDFQFSFLFYILLVFAYSYFLYSAVCRITRSLLFLVLFANSFPMEIVSKVLITAKQRV